MLDETANIVFPDGVEVSRRGSDLVYWSSRNRVAVKVGLAGAQVLEACRDAGTAGVVVDRAATRLRLAPDLAREPVLKVLDRMIGLGFLAETEQPVIYKPRQPESRFNPVILYLHLTVHCNLSCSYCYNVTHRESEMKSRSLSRDEYLTLIDQAAGRGVKQINFTGGEPLLSRDWSILAERAKTLGLATTLLSNGALITPRNAELVARLFDTAIISIDSPDPEIHDAQRGKGSHARAMRGIQALRDVGYRGLFLRPVLHRHNLDSLADFPAFAAEHCGGARFIPATYVPNTVEEEEALSLSPDPRALAVASARFKAALAKVGGAQMTPIAEADMEAAGRCGAGSGILSIDFNGDIYPCQAIHDDAMKMGNIREIDVFEAGERSPEAIAFRSSDYSAIDICKTCNFNEICGGGCRATAFKLFRSMSAHNPYVCEINKNNAWETIWSRLADQPDGASIDPADSSCGSSGCLSGCA